MEFSTVRISNCLGFERRLYRLTKAISENPNTLEICYVKDILPLFESFGEVREYPFGRKLIKVNSQLLEISLILENNSFIVTYKKHCRVEFEKELSEIL